MRLYALAVVTVLAVVAVDVACDRVPLTAPTASTINVMVDQTTLPLNGQATVRAVVIESGGVPVHNGTQVTFATTLGTFAPPTATTIDGVATTTFLAGSISGSTKINAYSGGASTGSGNSSSGGVTVLIGAAAAKSLAVSATPSSVSQSGGTVTIAALVMDESGNPLPGVNVTFSADNGQLTPVAAISDAGGIARAQLATTVTSKVTATAGTATKDVTVTVTAAPPVTITAPDTGTQGVPVAITVSTTATGSTPRQVQSLIVDFGDGTSESRSNVTGSVGFSHTYNSARGFTITAVATDVAGNTGVASKAIVISRQQNPTVTLTAPASTKLADPVTVTFGGSTTAPNAQIVSARVTLEDGTVIFSGSQPNNFNYKFGSTGNHTLTGVVTDSNGNSASTSTNVFVNP